MLRITKLPIMILVVPTLGLGQMPGFQDPFNPVIGGIPVYCTSPATNQAVAFVPNPMLNDIGRARPGIPPTIELNPTLLFQMPDKLQLFWYGHECAHHALGHTAGNYTLASEKEADCWSIQIGRDQSLFERADVERFAPYFENNPGTIWGHLPGPQRLANFLRCYDEGIDRDSGVVNGDSCQYANDDECDEPDLCEVGTDTSDCGSPTASTQDLPKYCCTSAGRLGPYPNPGPNGIPVQEGQLCYGTHPYHGVVSGQACYE